MDSDAVNNQKRCPRCGELKPATLEHFHSDKKRPGGLRPHCKTCCAAYHRAYKQVLKQPENIEKLTAIQEKNRQYRQSHAEQYREYQRRDREKYPERFREYERRYISTHPEKIREKYRLQSRLRRANNPEKYRVLAHVYNLRRRAAGHVSAADYKRLWEEQSGLCAYCRRALRTLKTEIDHIRPVSKGGTSESANLCLACRRCNRNKHDKTTQEWVNRWYENPFNDATD